MGLWPRVSTDQVGCPSHRAMILGINYSGMHDSSLALMTANGELCSAMAEERLSRIKKDGSFPKLALARMPLSEVSHVAVPYLEHAPTPVKQVDDLFGGVLLPRKELANLGEYPDAWRRNLDSIDKPLLFFDHHTAHAKAGFFLSGFDDALIVTSDYGAFHCSWNMGFYHASGSGDLVPLYRSSHQHFHPLCSLYSCTTALLGFKPNIHEGKVTGLAARGKPNQECRDAVWSVFGQIVESPLPLYRWVGWFNDQACASLETNEALAEEFRSQLAAFSPEDIARATQDITEQQVRTLVRRVVASSPHKRVVLSGGLFANVKVNLEVKRLGFSEIFVCPPMGDDGLAIGAAALACDLLGSKTIRAKTATTMLLGDVPVSDAGALLSKTHVKSVPLREPTKHLARLLADGNTVAVVRGRMEFGPRALGNRSILYQATDPTVNDWLNKRLRRTEFMPFAPVLRRDRVKRLLVAKDIAGSESAAEFMTICVSCKPELKRLAPAVVHVDNTARPQLVCERSYPFLNELLIEYEALSGIPALINTSFNVHDEPIVCSGEDALEAFFQSELDYLLLEDHLVSRSDNAEWCAAYELRSGAQANLQKRIVKAIRKDWGAHLMWLSRQTAVAAGATPATEDARPRSPDVSLLTGDQPQAMLEEDQNTEEVKVLKSALETLTAERDWLKEHAKSWQSEHSSVMASVAELKLAVAALEEGKGWLEEQWQNWKRLAEERAARLTTVTTESAEREKRHDVEVAQLQESIAWYRSQKESWEQESLRRDAIISELKADIESLMEKRGLLEAESNQRIAAIEKLNSDIEHLREQRGLFEQRLAVALDEIAALRHELASSQDSISQCTERLRKQAALYERERDELNKVHSADESTIRKLVSDVGELTIRQRSLEAERQVIEVERARIEERVRQQGEQLAGAYAQADLLRSDLSRATKALDELQFRIGDIQNRRAYKLLAAIKLLPKSSGA